jgi:hypothetical protein
MKQNIPVPAIVGAVVALIALVGFIAYRSFSTDSPAIPPEAPRKQPGAPGTLPANFQQMTPQQKREMGMKRMMGGRQ